jgi:hypothetical protein
MKTQIDHNAQIRLLAAPERALLKARALDPDSPISTKPFFKNTSGQKDQPKTVTIVRRYGPRGDHKESFGSPLSILVIIAEIEREETVTPLPPVVIKNGKPIWLLLAAAGIAGLAAWVALAAFHGTLPNPSNDAAFAAGKDTPALADQNEPLAAVGAIAVHTDAALVDPRQETFATEPATLPHPLADVFAALVNSCRQDALANVGPEVGLTVDEQETEAVLATLESYPAQAPILSISPDKRTWEETGIRRVIRQNLGRVTYTKGTLVLWARCPGDLQLHFSGGPGLMSLVGWSRRGLRFAVHSDRLEITEVRP